MIRVRFAVLVVSATTTLYSVGSVSAEAVSSAPEVTYVCCNATECDILGQTCCDAAALGLPPCTDDLPGICLTKCVIVTSGGGK